MPAAFIAIASLSLTAPGLQYDELHPTPAAFAYVGRQPTMFVALQLEGVPLLNTTYSEALKSALYGAYLRVSGSGFSVRSWRLLGILIAASGIALFFLLAGRRLHPLAQVGFGLLFLTDTSFLVLARHDYGPVVLAALLRLGFLAVWIRGSLPGPPAPGNTFALSALVAFGVFEKLSGIVLAGPLLVVLASTQRRSLAHLRAALGAALLGASPLILVNAVSWMQSGELVSPMHLGGGETTTQAPGQFLLRYLALGYGTEVLRHILGEPRQIPEGLERALRIGELALFVLLLVLAAAAALRGYRREPSCRLAARLLAGYVLLGVGLLLLPKSIRAHHWILGTPFQCLGIALALAAAWRHSAGRDLLAGALALTAALLLALRTARLACVVSWLLQGSCSLHWDPSLTRLGQFAASRAEQAVFVSADWGTATQIYCLSNGAPGLVHEAFWSDPGPGFLDELAGKTGKKTLYLVGPLRQRQPLRPELTARITRGLTRSARWQEERVEPELRGLRAVRVRKFVHTARRGAGGAAASRTEPPG